MACMWVEKFNTQPPMLFTELMDKLSFDEILTKEIDSLLIRKKDGVEMDLEDRIDIINDFLEDRILYFETYVKSIKSNSNDINKLDLFFRDVLAEAWE